MTAVTDQPKRYIAACAGCSYLFDSTRRHATTCGGACRVRLHRRKVAGERLRQMCAQMRVTPWQVARGEALKLLKEHGHDIPAWGESEDVVEPCRLAMVATYDILIERSLALSADDEGAP